MSDPQRDGEEGGGGQASSGEFGAYPDELREFEQARIRNRRAEIELEGPADALVGVGLSGGGIRSGTFALGLFQGLAKGAAGSRRPTGLLRHIDYLSTVSGGGYFGSFFGRLLTRDYVKKPEDVERILQGKTQPEVLRFLRENGRYMAPNGGGDSLLLGAVLFRNWASIQLVLGLFVLAIFLGLQCLRAGLELGHVPLGFTPPADALIWWSPLLWLPVASFLLFALPCGWAYWLVEPERQAFENGANGGTPNAAQEISSVPPFAGLLLVFVVAAWLTILKATSEIRFLWAGLAVAALLTLGWWNRARRIVKKNRSGEKRLLLDADIRNRLGLWLTRALTVTALLLGIALVDSLGQSLYAVLTAGYLKAWLASILSSVSVLAGFGRWFAMYFSKGPGGARPSLPIKLVASVSALLLITLLLVLLDAGSHAVAFGLGVPRHAPRRLIEPSPDEHSFVVTVAASTTFAAKGQVETREGSTPAKVHERAVRDLGRTLVGFTVTFFLSILFGQTWPFVNRSSQLPLYAARLTRAYLGASNRQRWSAKSVTRPVDGDDCSLREYWTPTQPNGAPVHLINVTINETIDGRSQVQQQDRKGVGLALGPGGLSVGVNHHLVVPLGSDQDNNAGKTNITRQIYPKTGFRVFENSSVGGEPQFIGETLPLGSWTSISGAAFSTGTGMHTSLGLSFLAGFANVRLGRWWNSGFPPAGQTPTRAQGGSRATPRKFGVKIEDTVARLFPIQIYLLDEFLARFPGTARQHWYLTDGGHFENLGGYELLRRRLRFIVLVDGGMDADSTFEDLANLARKARIDFGAEIRFLTAKQLPKVVHDEVRPFIGPLESLKRGTWVDVSGPDKVPTGRLEKADRTGRSLAYAALARVTYDSDPDRVSWLLYIKPSLTGREPVDLLEYHTSHPNFPHETTVDQFFDEAQWESYRRLGEYIAEVLFGPLDRLGPAADPKAPASLLTNWNWKPEDDPKEDGRSILRYS